MTKQSQIVVVGAGPAGSSLAIRLAAKGFRVTLIERERFPREKLCGEFISPECFRHFDDLGIKDDLFEKGGHRINSTRFFAATGRSVLVPTGWFGSGDFALSLSRAQMDLAMLERARSVGVEVLEDARVVDVDLRGKTVCSVTLRNSENEKLDLESDIFVDATGRSAALSGLVCKKLGISNPQKTKAGLVAFKNHFVDAEPEPGVCEIYFFKGGYGGLSRIEGGLSNFCFIAKAGFAKELVGKTNLAADIIMAGNNRAQKTLDKAKAAGEWLGVPISGFGLKTRPSIRNLFATGDAGAFIDPFTGSGMLMAMESSELLANCLSDGGHELAEISSIYTRKHGKIFGRRLFTGAILRRAAFTPKFSEAAIFFAGLSDYVREFLARSTRAGSERTDQMP